MMISTEQKNLEYYSTSTLAQMLDVTIDWLNHNRKSDNPIPYKKIGHFVRYKKSDVVEWAGSKNLEIVFFSTKNLAQKLDVSIDWLKHNRLSNNPVPFKNFGRLVRYQREEVIDWLRKNNQKYKVSFNISAI